MLKNLQQGSGELTLQMVGTEFERFLSGMTEMKDVLHFQYGNFLILKLVLGTKAQIT